MAPISFNVTFPSSLRSILLYNVLTTYSFIENIIFNCDKNRRPIVIVSTIEWIPPAIVLYFNLELNPRDFEGM